MYISHVHKSQFFICSLTSINTIAESTGEEWRDFSNIQTSLGKKLNQKTNVKVLKLVQYVQNKKKNSPQKIQKKKSENTVLHSHY